MVGGAFLCILTLIALLPLFIIGAVIDIAGFSFDFNHDKIDRFTSRLWGKLGNWINNG